MNTKRFGFSLQLFLSLALITLLIGIGAFPSNVRAATTITVTTSADNTTSEGQCSLREAITNANNDAATYADCIAGSGNDTIVFDDSLSTATITLSSTLPSISDIDGLTISGGGDITVSGAGVNRVLFVNSGVVTMIDGIAITNGYSNCCNGGGIFNDGGALTLNNSSVSNNSALGTGGIYNNGGTLILSNSTVSDNSALVYDGGGIGSVNGTLILNNSIVSGNSAGISGGGISNYGGTLTLNNSTVSGNSSASTGGGINNNGGTLTVNNSTISGNFSAFDGGGIYGENSTLQTLSYSTVTNNASDSDNNGSGLGGGIAKGIMAAINIKSSIVAGNKKGTSGTADATADCSNTMTSQSYNLTGTGTGCDLGSTGDLTVTPADVFTTVLGALASNSGPTQTHALLTGSPALDQIPSGTNSCGIAPFDLDQRGVARPQGTHCDIGSFESLPPDTIAPTVSSIVRANATNPTNLASVDFTVTFSETVTGVNTTDFMLTKTGVSGAAITGVSGLGATYTVSVSTGSGDGTIRLDVLDDDSILDAASNPLNGGFTGGETYNVDKNDTPSSLSLDNTSVAGNLPVGTLVGTFTSTDADIADTFTYSLVAGTGSTDNAAFSIAGDQLKTAAVFDSTIKTSYAIRVRTTDSGVGNLFFEQAFTITVTANVVTPSLLTPVDLELLIINRPTFDWTDVLGSISYHIQINKSSGFTKSGKVVDTTTTSSTFTPSSDLPTGITLYWRVSRNTAAGAGPWSGIRSFTIALPPDVPGLLSPKSNSKNISLTPSLDWSDSTPFAGTTLLKYELQISTDSTFTSPTSIDTVNSNYTPTTSLNPNTKYYWRVRACNTLGQCSAWSTVRNFTTVP